MPHGTDKLLLELLVMFLTAKLLGELFQRITLPSVLGEILAGILIGPHALNVIQPDNTIYAFAEIGAIFVLFTAGLETRPRDLIKVGGQAAGVAILGVIAPFALGFTYMSLHHEPLHESIFVAAAMVATSVGITARVLGDLHALGRREAKIILGAAVFDDILGMVLLAIVIGLASGGIKWVHLSVLFAEAIAFVLFMLLLGPRIVRGMRPGVSRMSTHNAPLALALALCLFISWASVRIGMAAIIGAFFAGLVLADLSPEWNLRPRVFAIHDFLAPFFFFTIGARLDLHVFSSAGVLWAATVISLLAIVSKVLGCGLPLIYEGWPTVLRVGIGMMPRGEVALIVALVGLQLNVVSESAYGIVIFMTAVTTILAPPLLRLTMRRRRAERTVLESEPARVELHS